MRRALLLLVPAVLLAAFVAPVAAVAAPAAVPTHTVRVVVRPVHADGRPVHGYHVTRESIPGFSCAEVSPVAVDKNIRFCGFSYTYTVACWRSRNHTVLCLRNPWSRQLVRIRYSGRFRPVAAPRPAVPQALRLGSGNRCWIRDGGAWSTVTGHPHWFGAYGCEHGDVYGANDGIQESVNPWRVHVVRNAGQSNQRIHDYRVARAYFVGTAR
jgi:hypothetical protein